MNYLNHLTSMNMDFIISTTLIFILCLLILKYLNKISVKLPPGPSGIPLLGYLECLKPEPHKMFFKLREKYGDFFGFHFGLNYYVIVNEYNVMKEILSQSATLDRQSTIFGTVPLGFSVMNGEEWVEQRRFSMQSVRNIGLGRKNQEAVIQDFVEEFIEDIKKRKGEFFDVDEMSQTSIMSNIISLLIGRKLDLTQEKDSITVLKNIGHIINGQTSFFDIKSAIPGLNSVLYYLGFFKDKVIENAVCSYVDFFRNEIQKHRLSKDYAHDNDNDFINLYDKKIQNSALNNSGKFFHDENLLGNLSVLFVGSSDTTSSSTNWLIRLMAKYPDVQSKVQEELDHVFVDNITLSYADRYKIPYTFAVILEAQRFSSIAKMISPRVARENFDIRGYTIPKGSFIITNTWGLHNDPRYWKNPELFNPERFLHEGKVIENPPSFAPFSFGKRQCPGGTIALNIIFLYFTNIIRKFEIKSRPGVETSLDSTGGFIDFLLPQDLSFHERLL